MTAGQLLDVQLNIEEKINDLVTQKKIVQSLRDKKTSIIRQETWVIEENNEDITTSGEDKNSAKTILNKDLGLE